LRWPFPCCFFIALLSLLVILAPINAATISKEKRLTEGALAYLELAPIAPRSLMQGDYMALRFQLANEVRNALRKNTNAALGHHRTDTGDGHVIIGLNRNNKGTFKRIHDQQALQKDESLLRYRIRGGAVKLATNAYFFQEGHGKYYEVARFERFRMDNEGELLLESMHDEHLNKLEPTPK